MPEQNIVINYKFNTAEIDKANAALKQANDATNKLQQSAQKGFSPKPVNDYGKSIAGLTNQVGVLENRVKLAANPQDLAKWSAEWKKAKTELDRVTASAFNLGKANKTAAGGVNDLVVGYRNLAKFAGAAIIATLAKETLDLTLNMLTLKGQLEGVERGFQTAFADGETVLRTVQDATHGTLTEFDLMKRSLQATNLGVSVEHLGTLFEFAAARAQQTGESVDYLVDSIVRGIGRKSPLVLDNLGISVTALKEKFNGASIASKSVAEATEGVAEIAKEQLAKMGGYVETAETRVKNLQRAWEEFKQELSKKIDDFGATSGLTNILEGIRKQLMDDQAFKESNERLQAQFNIAADLQNRFNKDIIKDEQELTNALQNEQRIRFEERKKNLVELAILEQRARNLQKEIDEPGFLSQKRSSEIREETKAIIAQVEVLRGRNRVIDEEIQLLKKAFEGGKPESVDTSLDALREKLKDLIDAFDGLSTVENKATEEHKEKAVEIKKLRHEIEAIEALLKDPKELKIKVALIEDDTLERIRKWFESGGGLAGVEFNPATGAIFDRKAFEANEVIDQDQLMQDGAESAETVADSFWTHFRMAFKRHAAENNDMAQDLQEALIDLEVGGIDILADQLSSIADMEAQTFQKRIRDTKAFYDTQQVIAGNNEKAKDILRLREDRKITEIRKKQFIAEQKAARQQALINGAAAVVKTFAIYGFTPAAVAAVLLLSAQTASQVAIINRQQPRFAKGVIDLKGPGTGTSDSIPAWLSKGESVMTNEQTRNSRGILEDIKARRLDDRILKSLRDSRRPVLTPTFDDKGIIKAIKDNRVPDLISHNGIVYEGRKKSDDYINKVRAKSIKL